MATHRRATNKSNTRHRHEAGVQRSAHGGPFDPTGSTDSMYGSSYGGVYGGVTDGEPIGWQDFSGEVIGPGNIQEEAVTPETFDTTPPSVPTDLALTSFNSTATDGSSKVVLRITWTNPPETDLHGVFIEVTSDQEEDGGGTPVWLNPASFFAGHEVESFDVLGVVGSTEYFVRLNAVDIQGNRSGYTSVVSHTTTRDTEAPETPSNVMAVAGFRGAILKWSRVAVSDLEDYVFRYAPDDGTNTAPDTGNWTEQRTKATVVWVTGLTPDQRYWFAVKAVDRSENESDYSADDYDTTSCVPTQVGAEDIAANTISAVHIDTAGLSADVIKTGRLALGTIAGVVDGLEVYDANATTDNQKVGQWDDGGIKIYDSDDQSNFIHLTEGSLKVYRNNVVVTAITPDGIDASAISFGRLSGGHNLIPNSSFEVGSFASETTVVDSSFTLDDQSRTSKTGAAITIDSGTW